MRLPVFLGVGVVELQSFQACACHEEERDVLDIVNILLVRVLLLMSELAYSIL